MHKPLPSSNNHRQRNVHTKDKTPIAPTTRQYSKYPHRTPSNQKARAATKTPITPAPANVQDPSTKKTPDVKYTTRTIHCTGNRGKRTTPESTTPEHLLKDETKRAAALATLAQKTKEYRQYIIIKHKSTTKNKNTKTPKTENSENSEKTATKNKKKRYHNPERQFGGENPSLITQKHTVHVPKSAQKTLRKQKYPKGGQMTPAQAAQFQYTRKITYLENSEKSARKAHRYILKTIQQAGATT